MVLWKAQVVVLSFGVSQFKSHCMCPLYCKNLTSVCSVSFFLTPRPFTCFHSTTKNLTLMHSVWVFQSQVLQQVFITPTKTSLYCTQYQFFNPKSCYMFPYHHKKPHFAVLSFIFSISGPAEISPRTNDGCASAVCSQKNKHDNGL